MSNIIFHLIITNQCNKRCDYCDLNFNNKVFTDQNLDIFIKYINLNYTNFNEIRINFFGGEALLEYDRIKYVVEKIKANNITYSIGTNGILLTEKIYIFFKKNNIEINYSIDTETYNSILKQTYIDFNDKNFVVNFILNPKTIEQSFSILELLFHLGIKNINLLPIYVTIKWDKITLQFLNKIVNRTKLLAFEKSYGLSYYDKPTSDFEYVIETNGSIYQDFHTHLWFVKQYGSVPIDIHTDIENMTYLGKIDQIKNLCNNKNIEKYKQIYKYSLLFPKKINMDKIFHIIHKILSKLQ